MKKLAIGLGSNLGDRHRNIGLAVEAIRERVGRVVAASPLIETEPWGFESGNRFLNGVVLVEADQEDGSDDGEFLSGLLVVLNAIESGFGRVRTGSYSDRPIDLDILLYGDSVVDLPFLRVPHPGLHNRDFVLRPLAAVYPGWVHPVLKKSVTEMLADLKDATSASSGNQK